MSIPGAGNPLLLGGAAGGYKIERSLRFNSADSAYLRRTPASAGNRKTWTWSGWVKRCEFGAALEQVLHGAFVAGGGTQSSIGFLNDALNILFYNGTLYRSSSTALFRDPAAWYHIVFAIDTTQASTSDRCKVYVNGAQITMSAWTVPQNTDTLINAASQSHDIGTLDGGTYYKFNGYLADVHFIDGQALTPSSFGETDINGVWQPKAYSGTYGTNGFQLKFADNSAATATTLGKDSSGNGNNWTPNNFSVLSSYNYSYAFDGVNDSASAADNTALRMGTGDFTIEFWLRLNAHSGYQTIFDKGYNGAGGILLQTNLNSGNMAVVLNGATLFNTSGTPVTNTWYHYALVRSGTTVTMYRNGSSVGSGTSSADFNDTSTLYFGGSPGGGGYYTNGYISNLRIVKGTAVYTSSFTPPTSSLTAITGTSLLTAQNNTFKDNSTNNFTITSNNGALVSTVNPFGNPSDNDSLVDVPVNGTQPDTGAGGEVRGNYATLNPLTVVSPVVLANGNLDASDTGTTAPVALGTIAVNSGKWYWEVTIGSTFCYVGAAKTTSRTSVTYLGAAAGQFMYNNTNAAASYIDGSVYNYSTGSTSTIGDVIGVALNFDSNQITFYKNGVSMGVFGSNVLGTDLWAPAFKVNTTASATFNFGQRPFAYTAPSGFKALCTQNLPAPTITKPSTVMDVALYTGNGGTQTISGLGFSPDLLWIKARSQAYAHRVYDQIRGTTKALYTSTADAEGAYQSTYENLTSFNSDGFSVGTASITNTINENAATFVAWTWDAGSSTVTNTSGTISSQVRANASAGFSIVTYTGTGVTGTVGHGLGVKPSFIIIKNRDSVLNWIVYHASRGATEYAWFNTTGAFAVASGPWNDTEPTSSVFTIGGANTNNNESTKKIVAYCFAPVAGYSAFGSYTGNGSADGPMVFTNMRPRWIMIKRTDSTGNWTIMDAAREGYNVDNDPLYPNTADAEGTADLADIVSNGFKLRSTDASVNASAGTYVYAAFSEVAFNFARAR